MTLTLDTLKSWLWDSADILRGSTDSSDFKNYIFGLLFLKRVSDVFEEEVEKAMAAEGCSRKEAEDEPFFKVPHDARWSFLTAKTENIGEALDKAFYLIEEHNEGLDGVMTAVRFGNRDVLSDAVLQRLLGHFNKYSLRSADLYKEDVLGDAYEYLIEQFADDAGKKGGEFYTPKGVVQLIVKLLNPQPGNTAYDPTCGSGGMLLQITKEIASKEGKSDVSHGVNVQLCGQEKNLATWAICKLNMLLHNISDADIRKGDTLCAPKHLDKDNELDQFDIVIANPPFSMNKWWDPLETNIETKIDKNGKEKEITPNYAKGVSDSYGRFTYGIPPRSYADLAFLQHMIASLKNSGRMGIVLPHGVLFRGGAEGKIRQGLINANLLEAVIGLPSGLFYNTGIPACILIINKAKASDNHDITFIDASDDYKEGKNQNRLMPEHIDKIITAYEAGEAVDKFMRVVEKAEIAENDYNLNIARYIDKSEPEPEVDLNETLDAIRAVEAKEADIDAKLQEFLAELGLGGNA
ncbi:MAG: type I restriction-modification system subunit M [Victivallaceae bacterium]|nr:type I restriction-modification system subunit M [Victivallaceae bacterium]